MSTNVNILNTPRAKILKGKEDRLDIGFNEVDACIFKVDNLFNIHFIFV